MFTKGANNSDHNCKNENLYVRFHMTYQNVRSHLHAWLEFEIRSNWIELVSDSINWSGVDEKDVSLDIFWKWLKTQS